MKIFRYMLMAVLILGMGGAFRASAAGFSWNLQDPPPPPPAGFFSVTPGVPFSFTFTDCDRFIPPPNGTEYFGCANGQNVSTTDTITSLEFSFNNPGFGPIDCATDAFTSFSCNPVGNEYVLTFNCTPGVPCGIAPGHTFNLYENAVTGSQFPVVDGIANAPEPSSLWLALSGMGSLGYLVRRRRRASRR